MTTEQVLMLLSGPAFTVVVLVFHAGMIKRRNEENKEDIETLKSKHHTLKERVLTNDKEFAEYKLEVQKEYVNKNDHNKHEEKLDKTLEKIVKDIEDIKSMLGDRR